MRPSSSEPVLPNSLPRLRFWYGAIILIFAFFLVRSFYLQVIRHDQYRAAALQGQFKEYEIPPQRGVIEARNGDDFVPIVLNQDVYTVFADPAYIKDVPEAAKKISETIGGNTAEYESQMRLDTRYSVLAKKISEEQAQKIDSLELKGIGTRSTTQRVYPQGTLAAQVLGFVDDEGNGKYGVEQFLDEKLKGKPGELKAITDAQGVPLVANKDNVLTEAVDGERIRLTIDMSMQRRVEDILKAHLQEVRSEKGSVIVMNPKNGEIVAMANYPTYNPAEFSKVEDPAIFANSTVAEPMEVGSVMKTLTVAAGLDAGVISADTSYYDPGQYQIGDATIRNVEEVRGSGPRSVPDILRYSLNTGATWVLMQLGGGEINQQARERWHDYLTERYGFGSQTGVEQGYEAEGYVPSPTEGFGLDIVFANTAFGQGLNITPLQLLAAFSSTINGGNYYTPHLVENEQLASTPARSNVVRGEVSPVIRSLHENSVQNNYRYLLRDGYVIGGKTGTAEVAKPGGGYYDDRYNGTFIGYVGGDTPEYAIMVTVNEPKIGGYAGSVAAAPLFGKTVDMLISNYAVTMSSQP